MAVSVDTVYQRVLALANKEQRGYITPQEYNLLANQAQMAIFESYFYHKNAREVADANKSNEFDESNISELIDMKLRPFSRVLGLNDSATVYPTTITVDKALTTIASGTAYTIINPPEERNTIYISEQDLPESVITQIAIQENVRDEDELVGAIVMGAQYYALKEHSIYRITWAKNPLLDAQPQLAAMRGAINHNCADQHENVLYIMDEEGPYAFQGNGVEPIGASIADFWKDQVLDCDVLCYSVRGVSTENRICVRHSRKNMDQVDLLMGCW